MKKKLVIIFLALLALSWYMAVSDTIQKPCKVRACLAKAEELESQEIYVDAITQYEQALVYEPDNTEISMKMAEAYLKSGQTKKFTSVCKEVAERNPKDEAALNRLMTYYEENAYEDRAVRYLAEYLEKNPSSEAAQSWMTRLKGSHDKLYCNYDEMGPVANGTMVVKSEDQYGLVDEMGSEITDAVYEYAQPYSTDGYALVSKDGKYFYIDKDGQKRMALDPSYTDLHMLDSDRTVVAQNGAYAYLDETMQPVTEFSWEALSLISEKTGAGKQNGKWALLNRNGKERTEYIYDDVIMDAYGFCFRQGAAFVKENGAYHLVDRKGKQIGEQTFENAKPFSESGYAAVCQNGKWGYADARGELVIACQYEDAESFENGFAAVCTDKSWGYIDETGNQVIKPQYEAVTAMSDQGTAAVLQGGKWTLIQLDIFK